MILHLKIHAHLEMNYLFDILTNWEIVGDTIEPKNNVSFQEVICVINFEVMPWVDDGDSKLPAVPEKHK